MPNGFSKRQQCIYASMFVQHTKRNMLNGMRDDSTRTRSACFALFFLQYQLALLVPRDARPPRFEPLLTRVKPWKRMRLGVQHDLVKRQDIVRTEEEVEVLECLGL